jgi:hypothetical protein
MGERLLSIGRHPVMMFGTTSSGKSTILMSFISNLMANPEVSITLGEPIYPEKSPNRSVAANFGHYFFERRAQDFIHGRQILNATELPFPIFLPINIQRVRDESPVRLAFLEGKGEWYEPSSASEGSIYQDFKDEIADVLKYYDDSLTAIFIAPYSALDDQVRLRQNDIGLMGALNAYRKYRSRQESDSLLFLLTKWDVHADPINDARFGYLNAADVADVLQQKYPDSWNAFQSMPRSMRNDRRYFMQYCAGYLVEEANRPPPESQRDIFERYPRTLLNWLYGNATRVTSRNGRSSRERVLFSDVLPRSTVQVRLVERVTNFILAR